MGGFSVDGLVTGLDTSTIISQLMQVERNPQVRLQQRQSDIEAVVDAYKALNSRFGSLRESADELSSTLDWRNKSVQSSDEYVVSASVTGGAAVGSISFTVDNLAASHSLISANTVVGKDAIVADGGDFTVAGVTITAADYGDGSLEEVVAAINNSDAEVAASAIQVSPGNYRLALTSLTSGAAGEFVVGGTGLSTGLGTFGVVTQGTDAQVTVGDGPSAYTVTSDKNSFTDVMPGLSFTANGVGAATITVSNDVEAIADKVQGLVDSYNDTMSYIRSRSKYNAETEEAGVFLGSSLPSSLMTSLSQAFSSQVGGQTITGLSVGLETDRTGQLSFNRDTFIEAYTEDPELVESFFITNDLEDDADDGIAERISVMAEEATRENTGRIALAIEGRETEIETIQSRIDNWDLRLEQREAALRRQFSSLETLLGQLQNQGQWLSGQLANLGG